MKSSVHTLVSVCVMVLCACAVTRGEEVAFSGKVVDAAGNGVDGARVALYLLTENDRTLAAMVAGQTLTAPDGAFSATVDYPSEGRVVDTMILVSKEGLSLGWASARRGADDLTIALGPPKTLSGVVVDENGAPVSGAHVEAVLCRKGDSRPHFVIGRGVVKDLQTQTDAQGRFTFSRVPAGATADFVVSAPGKGERTFKTRSLPNLAFAPGQEDIRITLGPEATIQGTVIDKESGKGVAGVWVMVYPEPMRDGLLSKRAISGEDGSFAVRGLTGGTYRIQLPESESTWVAAPVTAAAGQVRSDVRLELVKGALLAVRVMDSEKNEPVEGANVGVAPTAGPRQISRGKTDRNGEARILVAPGAYRLAYGHKQGYAQPRPNESVDVKAGQEGLLEVKMAPLPCVRGVVRDPEGKPVEGAVVMVVPSGQGIRARSDAQGKFEVPFDVTYLQHMQGGVLLHLMARHPERNMAAAVEIDEDTREVDVTVLPAAILRGKVVDPQGKPIEGARYWVSLKAPRFSTSIGHTGPPTAADGLYEIKAIPQGLIYGITAQAPGYGQTSVDASVEESAAGVVACDDILLNVANLSISGVVVNEDDQPVSGAEVYVSGDGQQHRRAKSDDKGAFSIDGLCAGSVG